MARGLTLHFTAGPLAGTSSVLDSEFASFGRELDNAVPVLDGKMSRYHFGIARLADGGFELVDNQATNGTYLNGERIDRRPLKTGDEIQAGNTTIRVEIQEGGAKTTP